MLHLLFPLEIDPRISTVDHVPGDSQIYRVRRRTGVTTVDYPPCSQDRYNRFDFVRKSPQHINAYIASLRFCYCEICRREITSQILDGALNVSIHASERKVCYEEWMKKYTGE